MKRWLTALDGLLRARHGIDPTGDETPGSVRRRWLLAGVVGLGATYGFFVGWYALRTRGVDGLWQLGATTLKVPLLYLLTLGVTFPSLYVFNTLLGSRLTFAQTTRVLAAWLVVMLAVAASMGPILGFFTISTTSYAFMVLLNVMLLGLAGTIGCVHLTRLLRRFGGLDEPPTNAPQEDRMTDSGASVPPPAASRATKRLRPDVSTKTLVIWIVLFGVVGLQMAWVLRPFIGSPDEPFELFRQTESHAFEAIVRSLGRVVGLN